VPPLPDQVEALFAPGMVDLPRPHPLHPSPSISKLRLEEMTPREVAWDGHRFAIDTPYFATFLGWGEVAPLYGYDALEALAFNETPVVLVVPIVGQ
jgi:hypothetical protein